MFNHADTETQRLGFKDSLFSWKFKLNNRDISAAVQPNNIENVRLDALAVRIMKLVNANSARFVRSQAKRAENEQLLADSNARIVEKQASVDTLKAEIESLHQQIDEKAKQQAQAALEKQNAADEVVDTRGLDEALLVQGFAGIATALKDKFGWSDSTIVDGVEKTFAGVRPDAGNGINPDGDVGVV